MEFKKVAGVIAATVTPFRQDGQIDLAALGATNEFLLTKEVHGL
jgi:dihydrodipicolinate synthase/N-acetylneuraminate lyase